MEPARPSLFRYLDPDPDYWRPAPDERPTERELYVEVDLDDLEPT